MRIALSLTIMAVVLLATAASSLGAQQLPRSAVKLLNQAPGGDSAQLELSGVGKLQLKGRFVVYGQIERARWISVVDSARDARLLIDGKSIRFKRGRAKVRKPEGRFYLQGSKLRVTVSTAEMSIALAGIGKARLDGVGSLRMNGGTTLPWVKRWFQVRPGGSPPRIRRSRVIRRRAKAQAAVTAAPAAPVTIAQQAPPPVRDPRPAASAPVVVATPLPAPIVVPSAVAPGTSRSLGTAGRSVARP